ncbi:L,D-transpeptidase family protein [Vallitalea okinawensis]|uniref:L,D-transpeptidase family protein n=1 Tax=Vallitalea okinawensis TaxID=2078660 RepID=UPI000CFCCF84|nr:L,D-transpeptidase family protein [Vallitalea okinawensis]
MNYHVKDGDTLYSIHLQSGVPIRSIVIANNIADPNKIYVGQKLLLPDEHNNPFSVEVDRKNRILKLLLNGNVIDTYKVAVGKPSTPTPPGQWKIIKKALWGEQFGGTFLRLSIPWGIYGIHGTNKPWSIGKNVSNGCIRMYSNEASELREILPINTPVLIY